MILAPVGVERSIKNAVEQAKVTACLENSRLVGEINDLGSIGRDPTASQGVETEGEVAS